MQYLPMKDREKIREQIVDLYNNKHYNYSQIAKICKVTLNTVKIWSQRKNVNNMVCPSRITDENIIKFIYQKAENKMKGEKIGSCREISEEIKEKFNMEISVSTVGRYLTKYIKNKENENKNNKKLTHKYIENKNQSNQGHKKKQQFCKITYIGNKKHREKNKND